MTAVRQITRLELALEPSGTRLLGEIAQRPSDFEVVGVTLLADGTTRTTRHQLSELVDAQAALEAWHRTEELADVATPHVGAGAAIELGRSIVGVLSYSDADELVIGVLVQRRLGLLPADAPPFAPKDPEALVRDLVATWRRLS